MTREKAAAASAAMSRVCMFPACACSRSPVSRRWRAGNNRANSWTGALEMAREKSSGEAGASAKTLGECGDRIFREPIADAAHGLDVVPRRTDLLAQAFDVGVHGARRDLGVDAPDVIEQRAAGLHPIAAIVERDQELELEGRQLDLVA